ncbi:circadian clock protein LdpA [Acaryochloris thomasi]|uniref:circadian clock protein LdpA n=1 Tax=Acaryochloris thomasi TaxID=2929456 RepID=UPI000DA685EA|nr:LdpA C-terminal domain-containing domain [Acaryochloris thomasi]
MRVIQKPLQSLEQGHWFKLICGASFQHLPAVRNLSLAYTLAGADCIDVAADPAVIAAATDGINAAIEVASSLGNAPTRPWLMVSLNDGEDPHFRKAVLDPARCPVDCPRPCVTICPAQAILFSEGESGVMGDRCYGCGRCLPICPIDQITAETHRASLDAVVPLLVSHQVDALEIHTHPTHRPAFARLWHQVRPYMHRLKVLAISCPDGEGHIEYLRALYEHIAPLPCPLIWQTDGRPMSGDIGDGTTRAAVRLGKKVLEAQLPGYVQLAGGTNGHTVVKLKANGLLNNEMSQSAHIAGVAYGSYARRLLDSLLPDAEPLEQDLSRLRQAVDRAEALVGPLKANRGTLMY